MTAALNHLNISGRFLLEYITAMKETFHYVRLHAFLFKRAICNEECSHAYRTRNNLFSHMCSQREKEQLDSCLALAARTHTHVTVHTHVPAHTCIFTHTCTRTHMYPHTPAHTRSLPTGCPTLACPRSLPLFPQGSEQRGQVRSQASPRVGREHTKAIGD